MSDRKGGGLFVPFYPSHSREVSVFIYLMSDQGRDGSSSGRERRQWAASEVGETDDAPSTSGAVPLLGELQDGAHAKRNRRDVQSIQERETLSLFSQ